MSKIYHRPDLWYGKYDHCICIYLHEAHCLRDIDQTREHLKKIIQRRRDWGRRMAATGRQPGVWTWQSLEITQQHENNIISMLDFLQASTADYRKVILNDWMYFYSNDPKFIDSIESLPFLERPSSTQRRHIELRGTPGTICLQKSIYQHRSYFRGYQKLTVQQSSALKKYLLQTPDIRMSPALREWVEHDRGHYIGDYYFIDHNDMGIITMLSLMVPNIIRRTKPIETAK